MGFSWSLAFRQIKRSEKMAQNKKLISIIIIILYLILLFPYIIASNAGESGIVIENKAMDADSLPNDVQDLLVYKKDTYNVILIEDPATDVSKLEGKRAKERKVILSKETPENGSFVRIDDITTDIYVTSYGIIDKPFEKLIIGNTKKAGFGSVIEIINNDMEQLNAYVSSDVFSLSEIVGISKIDFLAGGLLVVIALTFLFHGTVRLWNIPAVATLYSFQFFLAVIVRFLNKVDIDTTILLFGLLFIPLLPITFWMKKYEKTDDGKQKIHRLYLKNIEVFSKIKHKFGI